MIKIKSGNDQLTGLACIVVLLIAGFMGRMPDFQDEQNIRK